MGGSEVRGVTRRWERWEGMGVYGVKGPRECEKEVWNKEKVRCPQ